MTSYSYGSTWKDTYSDFIISPSDGALIIRASNKALKGPFTVGKFEDKHVFVDYNGSNCALHNAT